MQNEWGDSGAAQSGSTASLPLEPAEGANPGRRSAVRTLSRPPPSGRWAAALLWSAAALGLIAITRNARAGAVTAAPASDTASAHRRKPPAAPALPSDTALERMGAVIGKIVIDNRNIFNLRNPKDNNALFRLANRLHRRTRRSLIRKQLLFHSGERFSAHLLAESARILRADPYFYDASIQPIAYHDGKVDVLVTTRDVWTLNPGFDFSRSGGKSTTGVQLEDLNVLGTGTDVSLKHLNSVDRSESDVRISNQHAFNRWTAVSLTYGNLSDGRLRQLIIDRPFYALEARHAGGLSLTDTTFDQPLYDRGAIIDKFSEHSRFLQGYAGFSRGLVHGWARRLTFGWTDDEHRFAASRQWSGPTLLPANRRFVYPWVGVALIQDEYAKLHNHNQIHRTEDFDLGAYFTGQIGWAGRTFGSTRAAVPFQFTTGDGYALPHGDTLLVSSSFSGRLQHGTLENGVLNLNVVNFAEQNSQWLLYSALSASAGRRLTLDNQILLGGDNGLRGYPLRYQDGTARALFTIEERWFSNWYPFRLFRVGAAAFFDMGRTWGRAPLGQPSLGLLKDAGFGLRLGNARTAFGNVIHIDLAFPFDGGSNIKHVQFLVQTERQF